MEFFKQWSISVCATVLISTLFSVIIPKGNMEKLCKIIIGFFIFISFLLPFTNISGDKFKVDFDFSSSQSDINKEIDNTYENSLQKEIEKKVISALEQKGYIGCLCKTDISVKNNEVNIKSVTITIPSDYSKNEISSYVKENLGINATIFYNGE